MKKLGKRNQVNNNTIQAFATCTCSCSCGCNCTGITGGYATGYNSNLNKAFTSNSLYKMAK